MLLLASACTLRPDPINVDQNIVTVENRTSRDWRNVIVTVNDHFSGGAPLLAAGGRLTAPLTKFQTVRTALRLVAEEREESRVTAMTPAELLCDSSWILAGRTINPSAWACPGAWRLAAGGWRLAAGGAVAAGGWRLAVAISG